MNVKPSQQPSPASLARLGTTQTTRSVRPGPASSTPSDLDQDPDVVSGPSGPSAVGLLEPEPTTVRSGARRIKFTGSLLAEVSSERPSSPRWTVLSIYRTERGMYVVHRVGVSLVYHSPDCSLARGNKLPYGADLPDGPPSLAGRSPCPSCRPYRDDPPATLRFERDKHWAGVADGPDAAVSMLYRRDDGARSLPWVAEKLLAAAGGLDRDLQEAFECERL